MVSISLSYDGTNYVNTFSNGEPFYKIVEKGSFSVTQGFGFGSVRTQNCKCSISAEPAYIDEMCAYQFIRVYKDNTLVYTGKLQSINTTIDTVDFRSCSLTYDDLSSDWKDKQFMPVIAEDDPHRVVNYNGGNIEQDIAYTQAQIAEMERALPIILSIPAFEMARNTLLKQLAELRKELAELEEQKSGVVTWVLEYFDTDGIKVCDPSDTSHSLLHIIYGYLSDLTLSCQYSDLTPVPYFKAVGTDNVLDTFSAFLKQNGLYCYVVNSTAHIGDLLTDSGTATTITNIECGATISERPYIDRRLPDVRYLNGVEQYENVELYRHFEKATKTKIRPAHTYPENAPVIDTTINGTPVHLSKTTVNHSSLDYPHGPNQELVKVTDTNFNLTGLNTVVSTFNRQDIGKRIEVIKAVQNGLFFDWKLLNPASTTTLHFENFIINGTVLIANYNSITHSPNPNGDEEKCPYIFTESGSIRYVEAMAYSKSIDAKYYNFYTKQDIGIGTFVAINNVTPSGGVLLITQKTDSMDGEGGYTYVAVDAYNPSGIAYDGTFLPSESRSPESSDDFNLTATRTIVECLPNRTPVDSTQIRITIIPFASLITPTMTVADVPVTLIQDTVTVIEEGVETEQPINQWHYDIDPNLNGYDSLLIRATLGTISRELTLLKNVPAEGTNPEIIVPSGYELVKQYCFGDSTGPQPRWVADASYDLEDSEDIVSDIWWQDEVNGACPLRPRTGYYIWMRQGIYDPNTETEPSTWTISLYDTPYLRFDFRASASTYIKNDRSNDSNTIYIYPDIVGYDASSLVVTASNVSGALPFDSTNQRYVLTFAQKLAPAEGVTITATLGDVTWSTNLTCTDETDRNLYNGVLSTAPQSPLVGDSFVDSSSNYMLKVYTAGGWLPLSQSGLPLALLSEICGKAQKDVLSNIPSGSVEQSDYGYFNVIIAGMITAEYVKALQGVFEDIEVSGSISADHYFVHKGVFKRDRFYPEWF